MTIDRNFLGIRIEGTITASDRKDQKPQEEFEPLVRALLDESLIEEFGWTQRTPYFNDGDACVFSAFDFWVRTAGGPKPEQDDADEYDDDDHEDLSVGYGTHPVLGGSEGWGEDRRYVGEHEAIWRKAKALDDAIDDGHFDDVLLKLFGDHCKVKVRRDGITVDHYDHD